MADAVGASISQTHLLPKKIQGILVICLLGLASTASGYESQIEIGLSERYTDNSTKTATNTASELETRPFINWQMASDTHQCRGSFAGQLAYVEYRKETFGNQSEVAVGLDGICDVSRHLAWTLSDDLRDVSRDSTKIDSQTNRTRRNVFSTGPSVTLSLTAQDDLVLSSAFQNTDFRDASEADSDRAIGGATWRHRFNSTLMAGLGHDYSRIWMDTEENIYWHSTHVEFDKLWRRTGLSGSIGFTESKSRVGFLRQDSDAVVWSLRALRQLDSRSSLTITTTRTVSDLTSGLDILFEDVQLNLQETSVVEVTDYRIGYNRRFSRGALLNTGIFRNERNYVRSGNNETDHGLLIDMSKPIDSHWTLNLRTVGKQLNIEPVDIDADSISLSLGATYRWTEKWFMDSRIGHDMRNVRHGISDEFNENWILLALRYRIF